MGRGSPRSEQLNRAGADWPVARLRRVKETPILPVRAIKRCPGRRQLVDLHFGNRIVVDNTIRTLYLPCWSIGLSVAMSDGI